MELILIIMMALAIIFLLIDKIKTIRKTKNKVVLTEEQKEKKKQIEKSFNNLMTYDIDIAMKGGIR